MNEGLTNVYTDREENAWIHVMRKNSLHKRKPKFEEYCDKLVSLL